MKEIVSFKVLKVEPESLWFQPSAASKSLLAFTFFLRLPKWGGGARDRGSSNGRHFDLGLCGGFIFTVNLIGLRDA
jgi:hypothetical protein